MVSKGSRASFSASQPPTKTERLCRGSVSRLITREQRLCVQSLRQASYSSTGNLFTDYCWCSTLEVRALQTAAATAAAAVVVAAVVVAVVVVIVVVVVVHWKQKIYSTK